MSQFSLIDTMTIHTELWNGMLPIEFILASADLSVSEAPRHVLALASRNSYLPLVCSEAIAIFRTYVVESLRYDIWFEFMNEPLKWQYPIGVLADMHSVSSISLPWKIVLHFFGRHERQTIRWGSEQDVQRHFFHSLKQAQFIQYHSTLYFNELLLSDQNNMWQAIKLADYSMFSVSASNLIQSNAAVQRQFFNIPIRIMQRDFPIKQRVVSSAIDRFRSDRLSHGINLNRLARPYMQTRLSDVLMYMSSYVFQEDNNNSMMESVKNLTSGTSIRPIEVNISGAKMSDVFSDDLDAEDESSGKQEDDDDDDDQVDPQIEADRGGLYGELAEMAREEASEIIYKLEDSATDLILRGRNIKREYDILIQGISASTDLQFVPILDLWKSMQHPDQFLYISICK